MSSTPRMILFVDDMEERFVRFKASRAADDITWAQHQEIACKLALYGVWDEVWLDHDIVAVEGELDTRVKELLGGLPTFFPVACVLAARAFGGEVFVHSSNPDGVNRMVSLLKDHGVKAERATGRMLAKIWS